MRTDTPSTTLRALRDRGGQSCQLVAALLIAGLWRARTFAQTERWLDDMPTSRRVPIVGATLCGLIAGAFLAAQAGIVGFLGYLFAVILIAR